MYALPTFSQAKKVQIIIVIMYIYNFNNYFFYAFINMYYYTYYVTLNKFFLNRTLSFIYQNKAENYTLLLENDGMQYTAKCKKNKKKKDCLTSIITDATKTNHTD